MDDEVYAMHHLLMTESCEGAYNLVSPGIVQQKKFAKVLGKVLRRPAFIPTPPFGVWILFGKMGVTLTTDSTKVVPARLQETGYRFEHPSLEPALRDTLGIWR
jgi:NAD dependent epimerase/dehydratase family enzyme